jgi:UDP-glucose 4-epimerase
MDTSREEVLEVIGDKRIVVTGGTGSFGNQIISELLPYGPELITVVSRDEKKQYDMGRQFEENASVRFVLGDVRDLERMREVLQGANLVYHAAALKQVPHCEFNPIEAVSTNVLGAENVRRAAIEAGVECVVAISTDKAVKPVNVMGMSKAIQERLMLLPSATNQNTRFVCVRYGNVLGSRGSVVPVFLQYIHAGTPIPITHPDMTRFQLTLREAVQLVVLATVRGKTGELWVRKMPAAKIADMGKTLALGVTGNRNYPSRIVGARPGEKMHEVLVSEEEMWRASSYEDHFCIPSWADEMPEPGPRSGPFPEYASNGVHQLTEEELYIMLESDGWFHSRLVG